MLIVEEEIEIGKETDLGREGADQDLMKEGGGEA